MHRMLAITSVVDPTPTISVPGPCFLNQIKARRQATCSRIVFKAHRPAQIHLNTQHLPHHQDHRRQVQVHRRLQAFLLHLRTHLARLTTAQLEVDPSDHLQVTDHSSADQEVPAQRLVLNLDLVDLITLSVVVHRSWVHPDHRFTDKDIRWVDLVT